MADFPDTSKPIARKLPDYGGTAEGTKLDGSDHEPEEESSSIFPLAPFFFLGPAQALVPGTWRRIVSVPHLVLLIGILACTTMACNSVYCWLTLPCRSWSCQGRFMPLIFVGFCLAYFVATIQQYDEVLQTKQKELQRAKRDCEHQYQHTVSELEGLLGKTVDNQAVLAERSFQSHRRDFSRFLMRYERDVSKDLGEDALPPFRGLVLQWLLIFAECSIDPIGKPLKVLEAEDLDQCRDAGEVATFADERVKNVEVKFITSQREKDTKELSLQSSSFREIVTGQKADLKKRQSVCGTVPAFGELDLEGGGVTKPAEGDLGEYRWVQWGRSRPFGAQVDPDTGSFPVEIHLGFVTIILLSWDHLRLIMGFIISFPVIGFELSQLRIHHDRVNWLLVAQMIVCMVCVAFVLHQFLDMDIIQQLEGQLRQLETRKKQVDEKRARVVIFFDAIQQLADVWTHRTVTRLELMKHLQEKLMDVPPGEQAGVLRAVNEKVDALESSLPALEQWRTEEHISASKKKLFGKKIEELHKDHGDIQATLNVIDQASLDIKAILAGEPIQPVQWPEEKAAPAAAAALQGILDGHAAAEPPHKPGDEVEYFSSSQGRWVQATVRRRNPLTGLYDLDCKDEVPPEKIRRAEAKTGCAQQ